MDRESRTKSARAIVGRCAAAMLSVVVCAVTQAATLSEKARESGCVNKPVAVGRLTYRCLTASGDPSYFNVEGAGDPEPAVSPAPKNGSKAAATPAPAGFPKVDPATQKGRDDVRRKVLSDELATEEKLLAESRALYADGAPAALPEEKADVEKYRERIARLRQAVVVHEKNIEALKKELGTVK